jgi:hypothetical protein
MGQANFWKNLGTVVATEAPIVGKIARTKRAIKGKQATLATMKKQKAGKRVSTGESVRSLQQYR